jgi:hypothetical protein
MAAATERTRSTVHLPGQVPGHLCSSVYREGDLNGDAVLIDLNPQSEVLANAQQRTEQAAQGVLIAQPNHILAEGARGCFLTQCILM